MAGRTGEWTILGDLNRRRLTSATIVVDSALAAYAASAALGRGGYG
jgi:hypothetical protein